MDPREDPGAVVDVAPKEEGSEYMYPLWVVRDVPTEGRNSKPQEQDPLKGRVGPGAPLTPEKN